MNKVLITGASGFIGSNLIDHLKNLHFCIDTLSLRTCIDEKMIKKSSSIVHLAGKAHDLKQVSNSSQYYEINFELTKKLFDIFLNSEAEKFIFISSVKAAADQVDDVLRETDPARPHTHYGKSKLMAEEYILSKALPVNKTFYILRPCMIHGPGNKGNLNLLYQFVLKGIPYPLSAFENKRSFLSIENLFFVIRELLERNDIPSGVYNVSDNEALSTNELIKLMAQTSYKKASLWNISPSLMKLIAKLGDILKLPLNTERLNKLTENYLVDNSKIRNALGKDFPIQARDGIIMTINSFQKP